MALESGSYTKKASLRVIVWSAPDHNGDGEEVWEEITDVNGMVVDRRPGLDKFDRPMRKYAAPDGFVNRPGYDHVSNYVLTDERGVIQRQPNGEAVAIKEGQAVVLDADGKATILTDAREQYVFGLAHDKVEV